jgi:hypothetical protein
MRALAGLAAGLSLAALAGGAQARTPLFWGAGAKPCTAWNSQRGLQDAGSAAMRGWVFGMVSGYNMSRAGQGYDDVMAHATPGELWSGIDEFCASHPDEKIWVGVFAVLQTFDARNPQPQPQPPADQPPPDPAPDQGSPSPPP